MSDRILRKRDIEAATGFTERHIRDMEAVGTFPKRFRPDPNSGHRRLASQRSSSVDQTAGRFPRDCLMTHYVGATSDEIAKALGREIFRVRPRTSELRRDRKITDVAKHRRSGAGISEIAWFINDDGRGAMEGTRSALS